MLNGTVERRYLMGAGQSISLSPDNLLRGRAGPFTSFARYSPRCPSFIALQDDPDLSARDCRCRSRHRRQRLGGAILETDPARKAHSHFRSGTLQSLARNAAGACSSKPFFVLPRMQSGVRQIRRCSDFLDGDALMAASGQIRPMDLRSLV